MPARACLTEKLHLHGWTDGAQDGPRGTDAKMVLELAQTKPELQEKLHPRLGCIAAEVIWETRNSMARTVEDILARRTRALFLNARASIEMAPRVARLMAEEMKKDKDWENDQVREFEKVARAFVVEKG